MRSARDRHPSGPPGEAEHLHARSWRGKGGQLLHIRQQILIDDRVFRRGPKAAGHAEWDKLAADAATILEGLRSSTSAPSALLKSGRLAGVTKSASVEGQPS
jgi:hypothetical protein